MDSTNHGVLGEKHPLYICTKYKSLSHDDKIAMLKANNLCMNCLNSGYFVKSCNSIQKCRKCQKPPHTLLHVENKANVPSRAHTPAPAVYPVTSNVSVKLTSSSLLLTYRVLVTAPDGSSVEARALLDNASSASFVSERLDKMENASMTATWKFPDYL